MSDHLLLGASMTAILATEAGLALSDLKLALKHQGQEMFTLLCIASGNVPHQVCTASNSLDLAVSSMLTWLCLQACPLSLVAHL